jgi:hypothetical protein
MAKESGGADELNEASSAVGLREEALAGGLDQVREILVEPRAK